MSKIDFGAILLNGFFKNLITLQSHPFCQKNPDYVKSNIFEQLGFNLSNRVTDTLESTSILIYFVPV
jgi:hypothetical protein